MKKIIINLQVNLSKDEHKTCLFYHKFADVEDDHPYTRLKKGDVVYFTIPKSIFFLNEAEATVDHVITKDALKGKFVVDYRNDFNNKDVDMAIYLVATATTQMQ